MRNTPKKLYKKLLGRSGEKAAVKYLKSCGAAIIETNYTTPYGEADIIAQEEGIMVFAEVKTRTNTNFGMPCEAVDYKKQQRYIKIAESYLQLKELEDIEVRFDIIEILNGEINRIKGAFSG